MKNDQPNSGDGSHGESPVIPIQSLGSPKPIDEATPDPFNPAALRLSNADSAGLGVKRVITSIRVGKPNKQEFVRVHPSEDYRIDTTILEDLHDRESYLVAPTLWSELAGEVKPVRLVTSVTRHGTLFLWPGTLPPSEGRTNRWHESMLEAQVLAVKTWIRVQSDMAAGEYAVFRATSPLSEPEWGELTFPEILKLAFGGRFIDSMDHPILRSLRGEV
ncbi:hypothetical protein RMSM_03563 [Rhodopirellula maiorica SM1]|uniref:Uncharacterized protein n=1 Tax=Rhodopirellula maiorica SM1 TaxID=1265738 RepID=M5RVV7_9BACT|nr:hypothetical protein [Rhodopirellula maiorica]EMI19532.1 hypothetical protein RMSM_03563 [Rhodopirellula maiorica SM1]